MAVTIDNVAVALGRPTPAAGSIEAQQWEMWIVDAERLIRARLGDLALLDQDNLDYVVREAVRAMVLRPDDATQVDIAIDDGRVSKRYQTGSGRVTILPEWWALLDPDLADPQAFSVQAHIEPDESPVESWA